MAVIGFVAVAALWVTFGVELIISRSSIRATWRWFKDRPMALRVLLGIVFLPWLIALWVWNESWPATVRATAVMGVAWASLYAFFPWRA